MRLTRKAGLATRAALSASISGAVLAGSLAIVLAIAVVSGMVFSAYASDLLRFAHISLPDVVWSAVWSLCGLCAFGWFARAIVNAVRTERADSFQRTTPLSKSTVDEPANVEYTVGRLARQTDVPKPPIRVNPTATPLAFTTYRPDDPIVRTSHDATPVIVVSQGLIETLSESELSAVLAHELAHISSDDLRLLTVVLVPLIAAETLTPDEGSTSNVFEVCGHYLSFIALIGVSVFSRGRELAADRAAAELTGDPTALATALEKLDDTAPVKPTADLREHARSANAIAILPTLGNERPSSGLRSTHPPLETRLERLRSLAAN
ncbi:M48 family metalloprotease [Natrinema sp. 1APR25-10V2]|uniref:M48 family metallopeptidase n=1 Tax=Natrinema sp. 1APR25-10V2 TaxID=2951081 RepID=UPI00287590E8|nr:M48 family metalloprotease [Natrinema sp. 1APR25-10V2]MDS0474804.1 M48 family metalloprotease [Natrinema sp. 1APR25-10V2]